MRTFLMLALLASYPSDFNIGGFIKTTPLSVWTMIPLRGVVDNKVNLTGEFRTLVTDRVTDYATDFELGNNHLFIYVDAVTTGGTFTITGTSLSESTAVPVVDDTETITIDTTDDVYYQSSKKWWEVTNIDATDGSLAGLNYDVGVVGYTDMSNSSSFAITGYRLDCYSQGTNADMTFTLLKVQDDSATYPKRMSIVTMEQIGVDANAAGDQVVDGLRTGADDRSFNPAGSTVWKNNQTLVFKQYDFDDYFSSNENAFDGTMDEGIIVHLEGSPVGTGLSNVDWCSIQIRFRGVP